MNRKNLSRVIQAGSILFSCTCFSQPSPLLSLPENLTGTYNLINYANVADFGGKFEIPFSDEESVRMVLTSNGRLCLNQFEMSSPVVQNSNPGAAIWEDSGGDGVNRLKFELLDFTDNFKHLDIGYLESEIYIGQLRGTKVSDDQDCSLGSAELESLLSFNEKLIISKAEALFPELFSEASDFHQFQGYIYKFYAASGVYLGFKHDRVYLLGGPFGDEIGDHGPSSSSLGFLFSVEKDRINIETPDGSDISGIYDLTVSGTYNFDEFGVPPFGASSKAFYLSIEDVFAPNPSDIAEVAKAVESMTEDFAINSDISVTVINSVFNHVTFEVEFLASRDDSNYRFNLFYDYLKRE